MVDVHATSQATGTNSAPLSPRAALALKAAKTAAVRQKPAVDESALSRAARAQVPEMVNGHLKLDIDRSSGMVVGQIVDKSSGEVIKQIPTEEMLRLIAATKEFLGSMVDESV